MRHWVLMLGIAGGCAVPEPQNPPSAAVSPIENLVVACLDTVRYDSFFLPEGLGQADALTPRLESAWVLERMQSAAPWTVPSIATFLTGLFPNQHGAGRFGAATANLDQEIPTGIAGGVPTLAEHLQRAGFSTAIKSAHPWFELDYGLDRGFATLELMQGRDNVLAGARRFLEERTRRTAQDRFFLYLHFMEAHDRHRAELPEVDLAGAGLSAAQRRQALAQAAPELCADRENEPCRRYFAYVAATLELRHAVVDLLDLLENQRLLDKTLVIVFSDHGEEFWEHRQEALAAQSDPRKLFGVGHGQSLYQELLHVPFLIWHPGEKGRRLVFPTSPVDLWPSIVRWLGVEDDGRRRPGRALQEQIADPRERRLFSSAIGYGPEQTAVLAGTWKAIAGRSAELEIFDLDRDPRERAAVENPEIESWIGPLLERYRAFRPLAGAVPLLSDEDLAKLQALGYLQGAQERGKDEPSPQP